MINQQQRHIPVMGKEVTELLVTDQKGVYVDATYGRGGHSDLILRKIHASGRLFAFDRDPDAISAAIESHGLDRRFEAVHSKFSRLKAELADRLTQVKVSGIVADLGVSSPQLDCAKRGFSFLKDANLDLRMDPSDGVPASQWLQHVNEKSLARVLSQADERFARRIARAVVEQRKRKKIQSTLELANLVEGCVPRKEKNKHPATRTFLALRLYVNDERKELAKFLPQCVDILRRGGRLVVLTFHSVEDRIVKHFMRENARSFSAPDWDPQPTGPTLKIIGPVRRPSQEEIRSNRRARSAVMRVAERIG